MNENILLTPIHVFIEQELLRRRSDFYTYSNIVKNPYKLINILVAYCPSAEPPLHEAVAIPKEELCKIRSFGKKSLYIWQELLQPYGLAPGMNFAMQQQIINTYYRELNHNSQPYSSPEWDSPEITTEQAIQKLFSLGCSITLTPNPQDHGKVDK